MTNIFIVIQIVLAVIITLLVLVQKSSNMGLGSAYSGSGNNSFFGSKGAGDFITKLTFLLAFLFVCNTIYLSYSFTKHKNSSVLNEFNDNNSKKIVAPIVPKSKNSIVAPIVPDSKTTGSGNDIASKLNKTVNKNKKATGSKK